ncbi:MAG: hypothetical protein O2820_19700 [Planctomycetota bacterium]|nr:hypothetical protein [Planctomycetota bacterium]
MRNIQVTTFFRLCVVSMAVLVTANSAQASKLAELDDHAWTLERTAVRADRDIRYDFHTAPVAKCLRENFCRIAEKADDLQRTIRRKADPRMLREMEECLDEIDESFIHIQEAMAELRAWAAKCEPETFRYGSIRIGVYSGSRQSDLNQLCGRVDLMRETLSCMFDDLEKLFCECGIKRHHAHHDHQSVSPPPPGRQLHNAPPSPRGQQLLVPPRPSLHDTHRSGPSSRFDSHGRQVSIPIGNSRSGFHFSFVIK